jgi:hypothetical protein
MEKPEQVSSRLFIQNAGPIVHAVICAVILEDDSDQWLMYLPYNRQWRAFIAKHLVSANWDERIMVSAVTWGNEIKAAIAYDRAE